MAHPCSQCLLGQTFEGTVWCPEHDPRQYKLTCVERPVKGCMGCTMYVLKAGGRQTYFCETHAAMHSRDFDISKNPNLDRVYA